MHCNKKLILGSGSPRRRELLTQIGLEYTVITSDVDEKITKENPEDIVQELSLQKALDVYQKAGNMYNSKAEIRKNLLVLGADTVVAYKDSILGKPTDKKHAVSMIKSLQGNIHQVYTGVSFVWEEAGNIQTHTFFVKTDVEVFSMTDDEIQEYVALETCMDKAGAYGIQNEFACFVKSIHGDYSNVVGLPVSVVYHELCRLGFLEV